MSVCFLAVKDNPRTDNHFKIAEKIRPTVDKYQQAFPALLEIPSKDHPYGMVMVLLTSPTPFSYFELDPSKDSVLKRVQKLVGE
jgi:V-type H+-transporting ATPase subunit F